MTPKQKAEELLEKYIVVTPMYLSEAKQCALIAVDEIIDTLTDVMWVNNEHTDFARKSMFWCAVKKEIERL